MNSQLSTQTELANAIAEALDKRDPKLNWFQKNATLSFLFTLIVTIIVFINTVSITFAEVADNTKYRKGLTQKYVSSEQFDSFKESIDVDNEHFDDRLSKSIKQVDLLRDDIKELTKAVNSGQLNALKMNIELRDLIIKQGKK